MSRSEEPVGLAYPVEDDKSSRNIPSSAPTLKGSSTHVAITSPFKGLSWLDKLLAPLVLIAMIVGVVVGKHFTPILVSIDMTGKFCDNVGRVLEGAQFEGVSIRGSLIRIEPLDSPLTSSYHDGLASNDVADSHERCADSQWPYRNADIPQCNMNDCP